MKVNYFERFFFARGVLSEAVLSGPLTVQGLNTGATTSL